MQSLILVCLSLAACASATLVYYDNGAVAPLDPNVHKANLEHFKALAEAGGFPGYAYGGNPIAVSHPYYALGHAGHLIGKREADADAYYGYAGYGQGYAGLGYAGLGYGHAYGGYYGYGHAAGLPASVAGLTTYANGAVVPVEPLANQIAKANHLHAKFGHHFGKRSAEPQYFYGGLHGYGYGALPFAPFAPLVAHPASGAIVPLESAAVVEARHAHLAEVHKQLHNGGVPEVPAAERKRRSAQYFYGGLHGYGLPLAHYPVVAPFVHHPASGAVVPLESAAIVEARYAHLAEVDKQLHNGGVPVIPAAEE